MEGVPLCTPKKLVQGRLNFQVFQKASKPLDVKVAVKKQPIVCGSVELVDLEDDGDCKVLVQLKNGSDVDVDKENVNEPPHKKLCVVGEIAIDKNDESNEVKIATECNSDEGIDPDIEVIAEVGEDKIEEVPPTAQYSAEDKPEIVEVGEGKVAEIPAVEKPVMKRKLEDVLSPERIPTTSKLFKGASAEILDEVNETVTISEVCEEEKECEREEEGTPTSKQPSVPSRKKTPKQLEKEAEINRKKEEKARLREEKERQRILEKNEKLMQKKKEEEEKKRIKEEKELQKKKELEEKEEQKRKAREEKERRKQIEINMRNEEKRRREEEKKKREEELQRRKEEEAMLKNKYFKEAAAFTNYFTKGQTRKSETPAEETNFFKPFAMKNGMRLAPLNRNPMSDLRKASFDEMFTSQSTCETYVTQLRCGDFMPGKSTNTWPLEEKYQDGDISIIEDLDLPSAATVPTPKHRQCRPKLLQFSENRRPPYWGTWRKKCDLVGPRKPFGHYKVFDYEVDSDEEWEEEEPGESLHGSDDEKDAEEEDDYEVDNDFFVPHGYLSEDEDQDEEVAFSPEKMKAKLKLLGEQFDKERNEKTRQLRPVVLGCIWFSEDVSEVNSKVTALLSSRAAVVWQNDLPIQVPDDEGESEALENDSPPRTAMKSSRFPEDGLHLLIKIAHGALVKRKRIATEFLTQWAKENPNLPVPSMASVMRKVKIIAQWQECPEEPLLGRLCWFVPQEVREQNGCGDLTLPNTWPFPTTRASDVQDEVARITKFTKSLNEEERKQLFTAEPNVEVVSIDERKDSPVLKITKFTKVLSEEERKSLLKPTTAQPASPDIIMKEAPPSPHLVNALGKLNQFRAAPSVAKKRVQLLMSTPLSGKDVKVNPSPATAVEEPPKKKVAILRSGPCGVEIKKSDTDR